MTHWAVNFDLRVSQPSEAIVATWQMSDGGVGKGCKVDAGGGRDRGPCRCVCCLWGLLLQRKSQPLGDEVDTWQALPVLLTHCIVSVEAKGASEGLCSTFSQGQPWRPGPGKGSTAFPPVSIGPSPGLGRKPPAAAKVTAEVTLILRFYILRSDSCVKPQHALWCSLKVLCFPSCSTNLCWPGRPCT